MRQRNVEAIRRKYPEGTRIRLLRTMDDIQPVEAGQEGTVAFVDSIGTIHMKWDNGRSLGIIPDEDKFEIITD